MADHGYVHGERPHRPRRHARAVRAHQDIQEFYLGGARRRAAATARSSSTVAAAAGMAELGAARALSLAFGGLQVLAGRFVRGARRASSSPSSARMAPARRRPELHLRLYRPTAARSRFAGVDLAGARAHAIARLGHRTHVPAWRALPAHERGREPARRAPRDACAPIWSPRRSTCPRCAQPRRRTARRVEEIIDLVELERHRHAAGRRPSLRLAEARRLCARARDGAAGAAARRALRRPQPRGARGPRALPPAHPARARASR